MEKLNRYTLGNQSEPLCLLLNHRYYLRSSAATDSPRSKKTAIESPAVQKEKPKALVVEAEGATNMKESKVVEVQTEAATEIGSIRDYIKELFVKTDEKVSVKFNGLDTKFTNIFEDFKKEFHTMKTDVEDTNKGLEKANSKIESTEKSLEFHAEAHKDLEKSQEEKLNLAQF